MLRPVKRLVKLGLRAGTRPWITRDALAADLRAFGVRAGTALLVHSSLGSLGFVRGGARAVIGALGDALGPDGTLVIPTHTWNLPAIGRFEFDARESPSCVGRITNVFRRAPGVVRSLHPTHSVAARGPHAARLVAGHEDAESPCGAGTPYARLIEERGQILLLGATLGENTAFHTLEALAGLPYLLRAEPERFRIRDAAGVEMTRMLRRQDRGPPRCFEAMEPLLREAGALRSARVGAGQSLLLDAAPMAEVILAQLARNPALLVAG